MTGAGEGVIKTDVLGRMRTSAARRQSLLEEFDRSGLSAPKFAAFSGLKYQTLATWLQKRRRKGAGPVKASGASAPAAPDTVKWLEAVVEQPETPTALVLHLPGGTRVEINDEQQARLAAALVRSLASFTGSLKVFVAVEPCDLRKSFNGLSALVAERLGEDLRQGALFVFTNRRHTRIKLLFFDGTGLWVCTKRLEEGTFA